MEAWEIAGLVVGGVLAIAGAISTLGGAAEKIAKVIRAAKAPNDEQDRRITEAEKDIAEIKGFLKIDKKRLDALEEGNRVTQRALLALLGHGLDGNNQKQMEEARAELESHLINR
jgi:hypothetical protein